MTDNQITVESSERWAQAAKLFGAALPNIICNICKNTDFMLLDYSDGNLVTSLHLSPEDEIRPTHYVKTLTVNCSNCGNIYQFVRPALVELAKKNGWVESEDG